MNILHDVITMAQQAKAEGRGLALTAEQTAEFIEQLQSLILPEYMLTNDDIAAMNTEELFASEEGGLPVEEILK